MDHTVVPDWRAALAEAKAKRASEWSAILAEAKIELAAQIAESSAEHPVRQRRKIADRTDYDRAREQASAYRRWLVSLPRVRKVWHGHHRTAWKCEHTDRPHAGYGLCATCNARRIRYIKRGYHRRVLRKDWEHGVLICGHLPHPTLPGSKGRCGLCACNARLKRSRSRKRRLRSIAINVDDRIALASNSAHDDKLSNQLVEAVDSVA